MLLFARVMVASMMLAAGAARADVKVADDVWSREGRFSGLDYEVSASFQRAWLVLHFRYDGPCRGSDGQCEFDEPRPVRVPGLTYRSSTKQVLYQEGAEPAVVCAQVTQHSFIRSWETVDATGNCGYRIADVDRVVDDGFGGRQDKRQEIFFGASH